MEEQQSWDDFDIQSEATSEKDIKDAESMGRAPAGTFLAECVESSPRTKNFKEYSCMAANLKFKILEVKKIGKDPVEAAAWEHLEGKFLWDDINMPHVSEKDGMRKRRLLAASRLGLLDNSAELSKTSWSTDVIGKKVIITTVEDSYPKNGEIKTIVKVAFDGYGRASDTEAGGDPLSDL